MVRRMERRGEKGKWSDGQMNKDTSHNHYKYTCLSSYFELTDVSSAREEYS